MANWKRFVYILKSILDPDEYYVGLTSDPEARLGAHNAGMCPHTAPHRPWRPLVRIESDEQEPRSPVRAILENRVRTRIRQTPLSANGPDGESRP
jgi:predicted GIY-YIG superfamily endonuclease